MLVFIPVITIRCDVLPVECYHMRSCDQVIVSIIIPVELSMIRIKVKSRDQEMVI